jgi:predicted nucleic acid-binding Zn ribbon protein
MDKFKKQTHCLYCGKEMDAKYRSKKFCSDKCRVYFSRENKNEIPKEIRQHPLTPDNMIAPIPEKKTQIKDLTKPTQEIKSPTPPTTNFTIDTTGKHPLWNVGDPKENSVAFLVKYGVPNYEELQKSKK